MPDEGGYARGHLDGRVAERLAEHDAHLKRINGSMDQVAQLLAEQNLLLQRVIQRQESDALTVVVTADALAGAEQARRDKVDSSWSPFAKVLAVLGVLVAVIGLISGLITAWLTTRG